MMSIKKISRFILGIICGILLGLSISMAFQVYIAQPIHVSGMSMSPTIHDGETMIGIKAFRRELHRGDIIVLHSPTDPQKLLIKRVIALPGETFRYQDGRLVINNQTMYAEDYLEHLHGQYPTPSLDDLIEQGLVSEYDTNDKGEAVIPQGQYFVLGDNRNHSYDGDDFGLVEESEIVARAFSFEHIKEALFGTGEK